jgi:hypothetical protein
MSELQNDDSGITFEDSEVQEVQTEQTTEPEVIENSELAPDSPAEDEKLTPAAKVDGVDVEGPEGFKKAIDKQHRKFREEQRRADDLAKRLEELETKNQPVINDVEVPRIPDSWDEDYEAKIRARDTAILQKAQADALKTQQQEAKAKQQQQLQQQKYERAQALQSQFSENGKRLGVDQKVLDDAQNAVVEYGVTPDLANVLLEDPSGPLLVQYLAANPIDLHEIVSADPVRAGLMLAKVQAKAEALKPKTSSAPDPATTLSGKATPKKERGPKGATFE